MVWHDLSDEGLVEALKGHACFRRFCGFASGEATPEISAFVRLRHALISLGSDRNLFQAGNDHPVARAFAIKTGTLVDAGP